MATNTTPVIDSGDANASDNIAGNMSSATAPMATDIVTINVNSTTNIATKISSPGLTPVLPPASAPVLSPHPTPSAIPFLNINTNNTIAGNADKPSERTHRRVYLVTFHSLGELHHAVCVERKPNDRTLNWGYMFHVTGNPYGMEYEFGDCEEPFVSESGQSKRHIGWVLHQDTRVEKVCRSIAPPGPQWSGLRRTCPGLAPRNCEHWAADAIAALRTAGVLQPLMPSDDGRVIERPRGI